jgi:hypothetical protein
MNVEIWTEACAETKYINGIFLAVWNDWGTKTTGKPELSEKPEWQINPCMNVLAEQLFISWIGNVHLII